MEVESFTVIRDLIKDHVNNTPGIALLERESSQVMVNKLEDLNWSVLLKQLETDSKTIDCETQHHVTHSWPT